MAFQYNKHKQKLKLVKYEPKKGHTSLTRWTINYQNKLWTLVAFSNTKCH